MILSSPNCNVIMSPQKTLRSGRNHGARNPPGLLAAGRKPQVRPLDPRNLSAVRTRSSIGASGMVSQCRAARRASSVRNPSCRRQGLHPSSAARSAAAERSADALESADARSAASRRPAAARSAATRPCAGVRLSAAARRASSRLCCMNPAPNVRSASYWLCARHRRRIRSVVASPPRATSSM